jgi:regulator of replication initiation timing
VPAASYPQFLQQEHDKESLALDDELKQYKALTRGLQNLIVRLKAENERLKLENYELKQSNVVEPVEVKGQDTTPRPEPEPDEVDGELEFGAEDEESELDHILYEESLADQEVG